MTIGLQKRGSENHRWKGGKMYTKTGYVYSLQPNHRFSNKKGYVMEHRLIWEKINNASLLSWSHVHHKNGIRNDNRPENLEAMMNKKHAKLHNKKDMTNRKCEKCGSSKTTFKKTRGFEWYKTQSGFECFNCHQREYRRNKINGNRIM